MNYRREVDGLRALALLPVMLFHAGFRPFAGGFVGVDVFFVISGYLITSIILAEQHKGTFTLAGFYERRARRILPALFVVMIATLPFALFWLTPGDLADFSQSIVAVSVYASNVFFFVKSGYFDQAAEIKPFLHTWSLAVEEQMYLVFPLFMVLAWRLGRKPLAVILVVTTLVSLMAAQWASSHNPSAAFYLLPTRAWEILLGAIVAVYLFQRDRPRGGNLVKQLCGVIGMGLILLSVFAYDKTTPFPSYYTLVPTVGTALILVFATEETLMARLLGSRVMVGIGLISYSTYLWHQPLFAFARHRSIEEPPGLVMVALMFAALLLAVMSWKWVETPFRDRHRMQRRHVVLVGALGSAFFLVVGFAGHLKNGYIAGLSPSKMKVLSYSGKHARTLYREGVCYLESQQTYTDFAEECRAGSKTGGTLLWGDSHAAALSVGLRKLVPDLIQYNSGGCPPLKDVNIGWRPHCQEVNAFVMREVERLQPKTIILHASWISYRDYQVAASLARTLAHLRTLAPAAEIVVVGGVPEWRPSLPRFMLLRNIHTDAETWLETPLRDELVRMDTELEVVTSTHGATFKSAMNKLCPHGKCLVVTIWQNTPTLVTWDDSHLTEPGSVLLATRLALNLPVAQQSKANR